MFTSAVRWFAERYTAFAAVLFAAFFIPLGANAQNAALTIGNYQVVNSVRVSRLEVEFTVRADITNSGADATNVLGVVASISPSTTVTVGSLSFGDVAAGATKTSAGTFSIRQNRLAAFDATMLRWQVRVNALAFTIAITSPIDGQLANSSSVQVSGTTSSPATSLSVNGVVATRAGTAFTASVLVAEGANTLTAFASNGTGQVATASVNITRDTERPRLAIDTPLAGSVVNIDRLTVTGILNDTVIGTVNSPQASVTVNGRPASVANRTFLATDIPLTPGANTLTATATDRAGNVGTASVAVTYNIAPTARVQIVSGDRQTGVISAPLPLPLVVLATDAQGVPAAGKQVIFKVLQNDGLLTGGGRTARSVIVTTGTDGKAQAAFQLGTRVGVGNNQIQASVVGFPGEALFSASATPAPPAMLVLDTGNRQSGAPSQPLPRPFVAIAVDAGHNRLGGIPVTFAVSEGGGNFDGFSSKTVVTDSDGRALVTLTLGPDEGIENNRVEASFPGNSGLPVGFTASAMVPGDALETSISGVVLDNSDVPVPGATIRVLGTALAVQSDAQGQFLLKPAPVGTVRLDVDGTTVTRPGSWVSLDFTLTTVAGHDNGIGMPVRLLQINTASGVGVGLNYGGTITLPEFPGFSLKLLPGSVTFPGGSRIGTVTATVVHLDKTPEVPNFGQQPRFIVSINPKRCIFNPPAQLCLPNLDGLPPGQKTEMYSFDDDLDAFVAIGTGTVSMDGTQICSDPGGGVIKGGWHCGGNPATVAAGMTSTVRVDRTTLDICKGESGTVTATGSPTPPHTPSSFEWDAGGAQLTPSSLTGTSSRADIRGNMEGEFTARVRYRCKSAQWSAWRSIRIRVIDLLIGGPSSVCPDSMTQYTATTPTQTVIATWGGAASATGVLTVPATAAEGHTFTISATYQGCIISKTITVTDGTPGTQSETDFCLQNPINCLIEGLGRLTGFGGVSLEAQEWAQMNAAALGGNIGGGCADAARHAYWNALLTLEYSEAFARGLTDAHEFSNSQNGCSDNSMDIHNNGVGRSIAQSLGANPTRQQVQRAIVDALRRGQLVETSSGAPLPTGACNVTLMP